jgi:hypothetical protein
MDPSRFAQFEFEETEVNGVTYRLPIIDTNKGAFKGGNIKSKQDQENRYKFAQQFYRNQDEDAVVCKVCFNTGFY